MVNSGKVASECCFIGKLRLARSTLRWPEFVVSQVHKERAHCGKSPFAARARIDCKNILVYIVKICLCIPPTRGAGSVSWCA